jgi:hypothetical protein
MALIHASFSAAFSAMKKNVRLGGLGIVTHKELLLPVIRSAQNVIE